MKFRGATGLGMTYNMERTAFLKSGDKMLKRGTLRRVLVSRELNSRKTREAQRIITMVSRTNVHEGTRQEVKMKKRGQVGIPSRWTKRLMMEKFTSLTGTLGKPKIQEFAGMEL